MKRFASTIIGLLCLLFGGTKAVLADVYSFTTIIYPGAHGTSAYGINSSGQIVGAVAYTNGDSGFLYSGGNFTTIDVPNAGGTTAQGINDSGQVVGYFSDRTGPGSHGFLDTAGVFTTLDVPTANPGSTVAYGINNSGQVVGFYLDGTGSLASCTLEASSLRLMSLEPPILKPLESMTAAKSSDGSTTPPITMASCTRRASSPRLMTPTPFLVIPAPGESITAAKS